VLLMHGKLYPFLREHPRWTPLSFYRLN
jgi:hypothetical protein